MLTLTSSDGENFQVEEEVVAMSLTLKHTVEERLSGGIPVPEVEGKTLSRVIEWGRNHLNGFENGEAKKSWESNFMDSLNLPDLIDLVLASDYLEVNDLLESCCNKFSDLIRDKTPQQLLSASILLRKTKSNS